jgi:hypothetical protein
MKTFGNGISRNRGFSCSSFASAQVTGSRTAPKPAAIPDTAKDYQSAWPQVMIEFAQCTLRRDRLAVQRFLSTVPTAPRRRRWFPR